MGTAIALLIFAIALILVNLKAISKEKGDFKGILNNAENNIGEFQVEIGKLRREFAETLLEIQTQLVELEEKIDGNKSDLDININNTTKKDDIIKSVNMKNISAYKEVVSYNDKISDIVNINFDNFKREDNQVNEDNKDDEIKQEEKREEIPNNNIKVQEIQRLLNRGLSIDEVSDELKIGKGEVLLIKELYLS
jgi:hypothetical protein